MALIKAISYYFPETVLSNDSLSELFPDWPADKITAKTGIVNRRIAARDEFVSTMAIKAAKSLFNEHNIAPADIDFILLCTQSPDYFLPTTACLLQDALGIPTTAGALDFNLGCSGYIYGLSLAKGLILTEDVSNVLLITSETYSKHLAPDDKSVRTIFGDAAAATLITKSGSGGAIRKFAFGTDGKGGENLILKAGGMRYSAGPDGTDRHLYMNGAEIFTFTLKSIPLLLSQVLEKNGMDVRDIDLFVFHQANKYMLDHLRKKLGIPEEKFYIYMEDCGNTVSSTIPIALWNALDEQRIEAGGKVLVAGFGVGYSWGATILQF
jgi:3-oxoacyl-[acyl-carrier-protein] synthase III